MQGNDALLGSQDFERLRAIGGRVLARRRPWAQVLDTRSLSKPHNLVDVNARLRRNLNDFSANYALCVVAVVALTLLAHPDSLIVCLLLSGAWVALITRGSEPLVIQGRTISRDQQFAGAAVLSLATVLLFTDVAALLVYALSVGSAMVVVHASLRAPESGDAAGDSFADAERGAARGAERGDGADGGSSKGSSLLR